MKEKQNIYLNKEESQICEMFNDVSIKYDFLNKILSFGIDCMWRKILVRKLKPYKPRNILDVATGTGDLAIRAAKLKPQSITAIDISGKMIAIGQKKIKKRNLDNIINFKYASCCELPFKNQSFDAAIMSFGVRNFKDPLKGMKEIYRVMENNGVLMILEFGIPANPLTRIPFLFYFTRILPFIGGILTGKKEAYLYLTNSVKQFHFGNNFLNILKEAGFSELTCKKHTLGVTYLYIAKK